MKKHNKIVSLLLLGAMLMSLVTVFSVSISAETLYGDDNRNGVYTYNDPVIDGEKDDIWSTATEYKLQNKWVTWNDYRGEVKVLWNEKGLYVFGTTLVETAGDMTFVISEKTDSNLTWNDKNDCAYGFVFSKDETLKAFKKDSSPTTVKAFPDKNAYGKEEAAQIGIDYAVKKSEDGVTMTVEVYFPWRTEGNKSSILFLAMAKEEGFWNGTKTNNWAYADTFGNGICKLNLVENPGLPQVRNEPITMRGVQTTAVKDGKFDVRFVSEVIGLDPAKVGYEITIKLNDKTANTELTSQKVYTSVLAKGEKILPTKDGNYLAAMAIFEIPELSGEDTLTFTVKPFVMDEEGAKNYGAEVSYTLTAADSAN